MTATAGIPAARRTLFDHLRARLDATVVLYRSRPVASAATEPRVELGTFGSTDIPDMFTLEVVVTTGGDIHRGEALLEDTMQAVDDVLPATVTALEWSVDYDQDRKHWQAVGIGQTFR